MSADSPDRMRFVGIGVLVVVAGALAFLHLKGTPLATDDAVDAGASEPFAESSLVAHDITR
jgi:hypothetical protein